MKKIITNYKTIFFLILVACLISIYLFNKKDFKVEQTIEPKSENNEIVLIEQNKVKVDIKGSVVNPGVYEIESDKRIIDVISLAGGLTKYADVSLINLSKKVIDEMIIKIYSKDEIKKIKEKETVIRYIETECNCEVLNNDACIDNVESQTNKVSINSATVKELDSLPGIGESKAEDIVDYRNINGNFKTIEDIKKVSGIGDSLFEKIKDSITI